jgi:hypothetical protein
LKGNFVVIVRQIFSASALPSHVVSGIFAAAVCICSIGAAVASERTQSFGSEWTVGPWDFYGDTAAMEWQYIQYEPWDAALGELREVRVQTDILGEYESQAEDVRIRSAFFKGWSPANYQLATHSYVPIGDKEFLASMSFVYDSPEEIQQWLSSDTAPPAHYYFESRTVAAGHTISAVTTLTFIYDAVPDLLILELAELVLNYEESSVLSVDISSLLLRKLDQVMAHIDQNDLQEACDGIIRFNQAAEELASAGSMEAGASMLLISEANQIRADLYCSQVSRSNF